MSRFFIVLCCLIVSLRLIGQPDGARDTWLGPEPSSAGDSDREEAKLKLPPTIIDIEDLSELELEREESLLLPSLELDRLKLDSRADRRGKTNQEFEREAQDREATGLSLFEINYGFYDALLALIETGAETGTTAWKVSYRRDRDEGFEHEKERLPNSQRGRDCLAFDLAYNQDAFEMFFGVHFVSESLGLQANTNFSQLRNIGLDLSFESGYIISDLSRIRLDFLLGRGLQSLDHSSLRVETGNFSADARVSFETRFPPWVDLNLTAGLIFEESGSSDEFAPSRELVAFSGGTSLGFYFGPVKLRAGFRLIAGLEAWLAPELNLTWRLNSRLSLLGELARDVSFLRFRQAVLDQAFVSSFLPEKPQDRVKGGLGLRWLPLDELFFELSLEHAGYSSYPGLALDGSGLYRYEFASPKITSLVLEARYLIEDWLGVKATWAQRFTSEPVSWLPDWELSTELEFRIRASGTKLILDLVVKGDRHLPGLGAFTLLDLRLEQEIGDQVSLIARALNLLGADWQLRPLYRERGLLLQAGFSIRL